MLSPVRTVHEIPEKLYVITSVVYFALKEIKKYRLNEKKKKVPV
jgi:hypothetical protein